MKKEDVISEGKAITEGLERFLDRELAGMTGEQSTPQAADPGKSDRVSEGYRQTGAAGARKEIEVYPMNRQSAPHEKRAEAEPHMADPLISRAGSEAGRTMRSTEPRTMGEGGREEAELQPAEWRTGSGSPTAHRPDRSKNAPAGASARRKTDAGRKQPQSSQKGKTMKKGKNKKKSGLKGFLFVLLLLVLLFAILWYIAVGSVYRKMTFEKTDELAGEPMKEDGVTNILLIGNDSRSQGEDGRSDAMILISISNKTKKIYMTSLLRDIYVDIPGREGNRLNAAYAYGGPTLLLQTIEQNFDIEVNRYVLVNFQAFANLVDAVGGVDLELSNEEVKWVNAYLNEYNMLENREITTDYLDESLSGVIHLNGPQALAYCRNRYIGTDFERTNRQRKVLSAVSGKLPAALAANSTELFEGLFPQLTTNLTQSECYSLSLQASKLLTYEMIQSSIPIEGSYQNATIRSMAVLQVDFDKNKEYIRQNIYGEE